jgi:glycosyltransferase involved in cell wall biosynthesis
VPVPTLTPPKDQARRRLGLPVDVPIALCATRFKELGHSEGKTEMILDLLSVVPMLPDVLVVLAGDGPARSRIEAEVARLGIRDRVRLVGSIDHADLEWFFAACDLCAYPHPQDRPWTSLLEAQVHGRPVVTMRTGSGELTVDDGRTGLLANTLDDFRVHVATLLSDRHRCTQMGEPARRFIIERHSTDARAREIEEVLAE